MAQKQMSLREALDYLHSVGVLREPGIPGMQMVEIDVGGVTQIYRVTRSVFGMLISGSNGDGRWAMNPEGQPDTGDPATVGCLAALAREAQGDPTLFAAAQGQIDLCWAIHSLLDWEPRSDMCKVEGMAWSEVLVTTAMVTTAMRKQAEGAHDEPRVEGTGS